MKFKIKWRNRNRSLTVIEGLHRYLSFEAAARQVAIWREVFPANSYYIEPVTE
jgi:hypothetical protein